MQVEPPHSAPAFVFVEASAELGLASLSDGRLALADLNGDGRPDLIASRRDVFLNLPDAAAPRGWRFQRVPDTLPELGKGFVSVFADFDNDGHVDALLARDADASSVEPAVVFCRGRGDGSFDAAVAIAGLANAHTAALAVGDVNGDGLLDFYRGNWYRKYGESLEAPPGDLMVQVRPVTNPPSWRRETLPEDAAAFDEVGDAAGRPTYGAMITHLGDPTSVADHVSIAQLNYGRRWNRLYAWNAAKSAWRDVAPETGFDGDADRSGAYPAWLIERAKTDKRFPTEAEKPFRSNGNTFDMAVADVDGDGLFDAFVAEITHAWAGPSADRSRFLLARRADTPIGVRFESPAWASVDRVPPAGDGGAARVSIAQLHGAGGHSGHQSAMQVHFGGTGPDTVFILPKGVSLAVQSGPGKVAPASVPAISTLEAREQGPVDVFVGGEAGHAVYRIPSIIRLADGTLLAFAEARDSKSDNGSNDIVARRSEDGGTTWEAVQTVLDVPGRSLNNPCAVQVTRGVHEGRVLLMFQSYPTGCGEGCVKPGTDAATACLTLLVHSDDGGRHWSQPRDVTASVKRGAPVTSVATGPGVGIQLQSGARAGRVLMPFNQGPPNDWRVYAAYSDDGGDTWAMGETAPEDGSGHANEVQFAERTDGTVVLLARQFGGGAQRKTAASSDAGDHWTTLQRAVDLVDPSCMGGLVALQTPEGPRMVCTGPASRSKRMAGRAWFSADGGRSWPRSVPIAEGSFAYSVPVQLGPDHIGVLFERDDYARIAFVTLPIPKP